MLAESYYGRETKLFHLDNMIRYMENQLILEILVLTNN